MLHALPLSRSKTDPKTSPACLFLLVAAALLVVPPTQAQDVQVPFDEAGEVNVIDADLRERLGLFPEVDGFEEARLFRQEDDAYELVIRYEEDGRQLRERRSLSAEEGEALRRRVSQARAQERGASDERAQLESGRYRFLAATTVLGAYEGALLGVAAGAEVEDVAAAAPLLGATGGFFIPLLLTRDAKVTEAEATLTGYGGAQGFAHGVALSVLFADGGFDGRGAAALTAVLAGAEATTGFLLARRRAMRGGTAETMATGGVFGTGLGVAAGFLVTGSDGDGKLVQRVVPLASIAGSAAGAYGGHRLARAAGYTQGDARIFGTAGLVGTQAALAVLTVAADQLGDNTRTATGTIIAGALGGLALGHGMVRGRDFGEAQGSIVSLGAAAGSLAGGALSAVADTDAETGVLLSAIGSLGGFVGTYLTYRGEAMARGGDGTSLQLGVSPGAALKGGEGGPLEAFTPAINLRLSF